MKTYLTYAAYMTVANIVLNLVLFITGYQTTHLDVGQHLGWLGMIVFFVLLFLGVREARNQVPAEIEVGYGKALLACVLMSLFAGLFGAIYTFIHFQFINPNYPDYMEAVVRHNLEAKNIPSANIDQAISIQKMFMKPAVMSIFALIGTIFMGTIGGLIVAIFGRRPAATAPLGAQQPPSIPPVA